MTSTQNRFGLLVVLLTAALVLLAGIVAPKHNWDMVAYVAASYAADGHSGRDLQTRTYADIEGHVDAASYRQLTTGPYPGGVARDPVALEQQLPFYTIRIVYIAAVRAVGRLGGSYTLAAHLVTASFAFLSVLVMGLILMRVGVSTLVLPFIVLPIDIAFLARIATPDSMACFASLLLVLSLFRPRWWSYALIVALPAIRTDYAIFSGLAALFLFARHDRIKAVVALVAAIGVYVALGRYSGNYGYLTLLNFTLFGQRPYPAHLPISTDWRAYAGAISTDVDYMISDGIFLIYVIGIMTLWQARARLENPDATLLLLLPLTFATVHFALFPSYDKRFLVSSFFLVTVGILQAIKQSCWPAAPSGQSRLFRADRNP